MKSRIRALFGDRSAIVTPLVGHETPVGHRAWGKHQSSAEGGSFLCSGLTEAEIYSDANGRSGMTSVKRLSSPSGLTITGDTGESKRISTLSRGPMAIASRHSRKK